MTGGTPTDPSEARRASADSAEPPVSVIVPTHNRPDSLARLMDSLLPAHPDEVIVVDDGSKPPVALQHPQVKLIRNPHPKLVSAARNAGAGAAQGEVLIFIDDDCVVAPTALRALARCLQDDSSVGMAGPVVAYLSDPSRIWCAGAERTRWLGRTRLRGTGRPLEDAQRLSPDCDDFPSAFAVRRDCFEAARGFDERTFPMHMEEADLAARIRADGFRIRFVPEAVVWHDLDPRASLVRRLHIVSPERAFLVGRSRGFYVRRQLKGIAKATSMGFWLSVLAPAYLIAIVVQRNCGIRARLALATAFLRGVWKGAVSPCS
jgi:GT2 family glycosyltransferase